VANILRTTFYCIARGVQHPKQSKCQWEWLLSITMSGQVASRLRATWAECLAFAPVHVRLSDVVSGVDPWSAEDE
ncbi:hypothetical protein BgiMline_031088, partial [Biomphalaria glabrata]